MIGMSASRSGWLLVAAFIAGCAALPGSGPTPVAVEAQAKTGIRVAMVDDALARRLLEKHSQQLFSEVFQAGAGNSEVVAPGDVLEVSVWEAPPAVLFAAVGRDTGQVSSATAASGQVTPSAVTTFPQQLVDGAGTIFIPFAGNVAVAGRNVREIEAEITHRLQGKANQPQVLVRIQANNTAYVTIVGEVANSTRMPLTPRAERLLDALAAAGGTRQPVGKITLQVTRGVDVHALPLNMVIRDPLQNIPLRSGDVVTALYQPLSFTALGATGKSDEVNFEAQGISLAQALARVGGVVDARANASGVFIFRFESAAALPGTDAGGTTPEGKVPIVYRFDLKDPRAFFVAQSFRIEDRDVLYVANAPAAELQKFLSLLLSTVYPIQGAVSLTK